MVEPASTGPNNRDAARRSLDRVGDPPPYSNHTGPQVSNRSFGKLSGSKDGSPAWTGDCSVGRASVSFSYDIFQKLEEFHAYNPCLFV